MICSTPARRPDKDDEEGKCAVCYQPMTAKNRTVVLPCCHSFCYHCIVHWMKIRSICPVCMSLSEMLLYSIKSDSEYKILPIRPSSIQLECEKPAAFVPHLFINDRGEYECTVIETNRIRH
ncbi:hypothetical protein WA556_002078, partial [Blastocystis sp. ATCC 50177/Nand II]